MFVYYVITSSLSVLWNFLFVLIIYLLIFVCRSAPEFGSMPKDSVLRKTQSHPASGTKNSSPLAASGKKGRQDSEKHKRCKSVPMPLPEITGEQGEDSSFSKLSCPNSPTETSKDSVSQRKSSPVGDSRSESPKPKKTNFRGIRSLQRKAKNEGGSGAGGNSSGGGQMSSSSTATAASATTTTETYANMHSMPDIVQDSGGRTSSTEPGVARAPLSQPTDTDQVPVSASSLTSWWCGDCQHHLPLLAPPCPVECARVSCVTFFVSAQLGQSCSFSKSVSLQSVWCLTTWILMAHLHFHSDVDQKQRKKIKPKQKVKMESPVLNMLWIISSEDNETTVLAACKSVILCFFPNPIRKK